MFSSGQWWIPLLMAMSLFPVTVGAQSANQLPSQTRGSAGPARHEPLEVPDSLERPSLRSGLWARLETHQLDRRIRWASLPEPEYARQQQQSGAPKRSWIARHPVFFGALTGFGTGFLIGYTAGDDGVLDDFTAGFNGLVLGGIGAGAGAAAGAVVEAFAD